MAEKVAMRSTVRCRAGGAMFLNVQDAVVRATGSLPVVNPLMRQVVGSRVYPRVKVWCVLARAARIPAGGRSNARCARLAHAGRSSVQFHGEGMSSRCARQRQKWREA